MPPPGPTATFPLMVLLIMSPLAPLRAESISSNWGAVDLWRARRRRSHRSDPSTLDVGQLCVNQTGGHGTGSVLQVSCRGLSGPAHSQITSARYMNSWASGGDEPFGRRVSQRHPFRSDRVQPEPG
jgi:hypothetical protein